MAVWVHSFILQRLWMETALQLHVSSCLKELFNSPESSNFNILPTSSCPRLTMNIYNSISNGNNPTFSNLNICIAQSCMILFIYLSRVCSAQSVQSIYFKLNVNLTAIVNLQQCNSLRNWKVWGNCPLSFDTNQFPLFRCYQTTSWWQSRV